ncbi:unnamed protein product [Cylindrotheca closterium]|uniref:Uncharacterized protein n=1 Tax=Cylindrotheca closterium TaxID=2856 RepID=A0AAD2CJG1_9STRA|nr:unnamed protein product [Cylindrotheca closterium]
MVKISPLVRLPSGLMVNIFTKGGVQAFLESELSQTYLSSDLRTIKDIRKTKNRTSEAEDLLFSLTAKIEFIATLADPILFAETVPESEIEVWFIFVLHELKALSAKPDWLRSGELDEDDMSCLNISAAMFHFHAVPVQLAFECEYVQLLADFLKACPTTLPSTEIAGQITNIVSRII